MTDFYYESYPPWILNTRPDGEFAGSWTLTANDPPNAGEANISSFAVAVYGTDGAGGDATALFDAVGQDDEIAFVGASGWIDYTVNATAKTGGVYEFAVTVREQHDTPPADGAVVGVIINPFGARGGTPPPPPVTVPTSSWVKADIVAWLLLNGVAVGEPALSALTKSELLDLVEDILNDDEEALDADLANLGLAADEEGLEE